MWWQKTAKVWLGEKEIHILKIKRNLLGRVAAYQEDTYPLPLNKADWLCKPQQCYPIFSGFLRCYGLSSWRVELLLSGRGCMGKRLVLGTKGKKEALHWIAEEELLGEETAQLAFDAVQPQLNDSGLYTWSVGAYDQACIASLCQAARDEKVILTAIRLFKLSEEKKIPLNINLLPAACQKQTTFYLAPLTWLVCGLLVLTAGAGMFFQQNLAEQQRIYTDQVFPRQEKVKQYNARLAAWQKLADKEEKEETRHWPGILVALAETKPPEISLKQMVTEGTKVQFRGEAPSDAAPRKWQKALAAQQEVVGKKSLGKMQKQKEGNVTFSLEISG